MTRSLNEMIEMLETLNLSVRRQLESAEAYAVGINQVIEHLTGIGLIEPMMLLGDIIHEARYNPRYGKEDSTRLLQAAIGLGYGGIGVVLWDSERYWEFIRSPGPPTSEIEVNFTPFNECPAAVKGLLMPQLYPLTVRVCQLVNIDFDTDSVS